MVDARRRAMVENDVGMSSELKEVCWVENGTDR